MSGSRKDAAALGIVASNALTLVIAWWQHWPLVLMLWPYWAQSLVIGWYARKRILALRRFSTENFRVNDAAVAPTPETQRSTASFLALHYGFFHLIYFVFLATMTAKTFAAHGTATGPAWLGGMGVLNATLILALSVAFFFTHGASHREHVEADLRRTPNIGTLMFMPYLRVIPMHLSILLGLAWGDGAGRLLFGALKTGADVAMHKIEHHWLQAGRGRARGVVE